jgi:hypothetical protein
MTQTRASHKHSAEPILSGNSRHDFATYRSAWVRIEELKIPSVVGCQWSGD